MQVEDLQRLAEASYQLNELPSLKTARCHWKHVVRFFNGTEVARISTAMVEDYKAHRLGQGAARATVNNELWVLSRGFTLALRQRLLRRRPFIERLKVYNARQGFVDPPDYQRIVKALEILDPPSADIVRFLYLLGWRLGEVLRLDWQEVNVEAGSVRLPPRRTKNRQPRAIRVGSLLHAVLRRRWEHRLGDAVFHRAGRPVKDFRGSWDRAAAAVAKSGLHRHDLRRSFARNGVLAHVPLKTIMLIGGWRTLDTFFRYCILDEHALGLGAAQIEDYTERFEEIEAKLRGHWGAAALTPDLSQHYRELGGGPV